MYIFLYYLLIMLVHVLCAVLFDPYRHNNIWSKTKGNGCFCYCCTKISKKVFYKFLRIFSATVAKMAAMVYNNIKVVIKTIKVVISGEFST